MRADNLRSGSSDTSGTSEHDGHSLSSRLGPIARHPLSVHILMWPSASLRSPEFMADEPPETQRTRVAAPNITRIHTRADWPRWAHVWLRSVSTNNIFHFPTISAVSVRGQRVSEIPTIGL